MVFLSVINLVLNIQMAIHTVYLIGSIFFEYISISLNAVGFIFCAFLFFSLVLSVL